MPVVYALGVITVAHWEDVLPWYEQLFGKPASNTPMDGCAEWELLEGGGVQVIRDAKRAGSALLTVGVDDIDAVKARLGQQGIEGEFTPGPSFALLRVTDPEGNIVTFAQPRT